MTLFFASIPAHGTGRDVNTSAESATGETANTEQKRPPELTAVEIADICLGPVAN